jgi:hypothetical protein
VKYWEGYGKIAFDAGKCIIHQPHPPGVPYPHSVVATPSSQSYPEVRDTNLRVPTAYAPMPSFTSLAADHSAGQRSLYTDCCLKIPMSLIRRRTSPSSTALRPINGKGDMTELSLPQSVMYGGPPPPASEEANSDYGYGQGLREEYREIKCCFSVTIRRDA